MTINLSANSPRVSYTVSEGATTSSFTVSFEFFAAADLNVYVDGATKVLGSGSGQYAVSGGDGSTGAVALSVTGATGGSTVVITRDIGLERTTDFPSSGSFQIGTLNTELDRFVAIAADQKDSTDRSLRISDFEVASSTNLILPAVAARASGFLTFDSSGNVSISTIENLDLLNLEQLNLDNITIDGDTVSTSSGNGLALSSGDDLEFVVPASNARIYFKRATATAIDWSLAGSSSSLRFINNQSSGVFASITSTHLTSSSSTLELRSEGAGLTLNSGGGTIPLEHDGTQRGYLKLDTAGTIKIYTGTGTGTLSTTISGDDLTVVGTLTAGSLVIGDADIAEVEFEMIDGITAGTVAAGKAVVVDANKDASSFRNLTATGAITGGSLVIGSADISEAELETIDGITAGTILASKAVVVDANKDISSFRNLTATGLISDTLNVTGDVLFEDTAVGNSFVIKNTSGSGGSAPDLVLYRRSSSLSNGDDLGRLTFRGIDDGYTERDFFSWQVELIEKAANTASAELHLNTHVGGDGSSNKVTFFSSGNIDTVGAYSSKNATGGVLNLQSSDTTITSGSALGTINFSAPNEGSGTDAILVGASITALSEGTFAADNNATELVFKTGASDSASEKMKLTSTGDLLLASSSIAYGTFTAGDAILKSPDQTRGAILSIQTLHSSIDDGDVLGSIQFNAPDEGSDGDSRLVGAAIEAVAEGAFTSTANPTEILFKTGASEAATTKMTLSSLGNLTLTSTTASTSSTTGSLIVGGGVGIAADLFVGDDFDVAGDAVIDLTCLVTGVLTTTAATVFNGGFASNAPSTITTADNLDQLNIISTDADANSGPGISLYRNSGSPADNDGLGKIAFHFEDDGDNKVRGGGIFTTLLDASDGTEDVSMILETMIAGAEGQRISMLPTEIVINDSSIDLDFRVESNLDTHALFVDGAQSGAVGIGVTPEIWSSSLDFLQIGTAASFWGSTNTSVAVVQSNAYFNASDTYKYINTDQAAQYIQVDGTHVFSSAVSGSADATVTFVESLKIDASSNILIASTGGTLSTATAGTSNLRLGVNAGNSILSGGNQNVLLGDEAGTAITLGDENVFVGFQSGDALVDGTFNVAIGSNSLTADTKGKKSVAVGTNALSTQNFTSLTDTFNTAVGHSAGTGVTSGINNTLIGALAGAALTTATKNTHVGYSAGGVGVITGTRNCTLGHEAGKALTSGASNVYIGAFTGKAETTGTANTAIGDAAYITEADGDENTAIGSQALKLNQSASNENTMIGSKAGFGNGSSATTFGGCTFVGRNTGNSGRSSTFATLVGRNVDQSGAAVNAEIVLGSNVVGGGANTVRVGTAAGNATIDCDGSDTSWAASSDSRLKTDVATCAVGLDFIKDLRPITFKWNTKDAVANTLPQYDADKSEPVYGSGQIQHGFLAQEVKTAIDAHSGLKNGFTMWSEDPNGTQQVAPAALIPMLVKAIQELEARIAVLEG